MLIKVKHRETKKYVKLEEVSFTDFMSAVQQKFLIPENAALKVTDEQGIEVDEDVFPELAGVKEVCFVIYTAEDILETESSKKLRDCSDLTHYVTLTPCDLTVLKQHVEEPSSPSLTDTLSVSTTSSQSSDTSDAGLQMTVEQILTSKPAGVTVIHEYEKTGSLKDSTRRLMVNIIVASTKEFHALGIVSLFPSLKDPYSKKGYILQDFAMMFGVETASRFLEKWNTSFKDKVAREARDLKETCLLKRLLKSALNEEMDDADEPAGRKRPKKMSVGEAIDHLVKFHKSCQSLEDHLMNNEGNPQPYLLATGTSKAQVFSFYIVLDRKLLPCQSGTSLGAFDELFKCHFVFSVKYEDALSSLYTFLQTTVYNIDVGTTVESPRVKELRAKLLNK
uniref:uncharacterized protein LOC106676715 n=1 Tax=Maylandia zebra TaxID=106582 RepID=UPI000D2FE6CA|nr:uncharacterized protein LOC106676715 [Maylandia zebra]